MSIEVEKTTQLVVTTTTRITLRAEQVENILRRWAEREHGLPSDATQVSFVYLEFAGVKSVYLTCIRQEQSEQ